MPGGNGGDTLEAWAERTGRRRAADHGRAGLRFAFYGGVHAELADGLVTVIVPRTDHKDAAAAALDAYAITWRFE